jgi:hypothetical protein
VIPFWVVVVVFFFFFCLPILVRVPIIYILMGSDALLCHGICRPCD